MQRRVVLAVGGSLLALAAGCGSSAKPAGAGSSAGSGSSGAAASVGTRQTPLGTFLVDAQGRTLYLFEKDGRDSSACSDQCASVWPPLTTTGAPAAGTGVQAGLLATIDRGDGTKQVTYDHHPLYRYASDSGPGDTKGQAIALFGAEWYVVAPSGEKIDEEKGGSGGSSASPSASSTYNR